MWSKNKGERHLALGVCLLAGFSLAAAAQTPVSPPKLETAEQTNERIRALAGGPLLGSRPTRIGPGDLITVEVFDVPELSREARVSDSGFISLPLVGVPIQVSGLTTGEAEEKIGEILQAKGLVTHPQVIVTMKDQRSHPITVIGEVRNPQVIQAVRSMTLLEVLSTAGGIQDAAGNTVLITRRSSALAETDAQNSADVNDGNVSNPPPNGSAPGSIFPKGDALAQNASTDTMPGTEQQISVKLSDLLDDPSPERNIMVYGGDIVTVPRGGIVYVVGAVMRPGGFVLQSDADRMTVLKAMALAGGQQPTAKLKNALILRPNKRTGKDDEIPVNLKRILQRKGEDASLRPNDILFVPDSAGLHALRAVGSAAVGAGTGVALWRVGTI
jgi:polysaccharide biosynthesis/export protein